MLTQADITAFTSNVEGLLCECETVFRECERLKAEAETDRHAAACLFARYGICDCGFLYQVAQQDTFSRTVVGGNDLERQSQQLAKLEVTP